MYLASFLVRLFVKVKAEVADSWQVVELKVLTPEDSIGSGLAGGAGVKHVIQAQFTIITLFGWELTGLDDPQLQNVVDASTVVLSVRNTDGKANTVIFAPYKLQVRVVRGFADLQMCRQACRQTAETAVI